LLVALATAMCATAANAVDCGHEGTLFSAACVAINTKSLTVYQPSKVHVMGANTGYPHIRRSTQTAMLWSDKNTAHGTPVCMQCLLLLTLPCGLENQHLENQHHVL